MPLRCSLFRARSFLLAECAGFFCREFFATAVSIEVPSVEPPDYTRRDWWKTEQGCIPKRSAEIHILSLEILVRTDSFKGCRCEGGSMANIRRRRTGSYPMRPRSAPSTFAVPLNVKEQHLT